MLDDNLMDFLVNDEEIIEKNPLYKYKILIADDNESIHEVTKLSLGKTKFDGYPIEFYDTYSGKETIDFMRKEDDIAIVFLDVVMETEDAGLKVAKAIREELKNQNTRIILRTGQPGQAPENEVITQYDINDYKTKVELTTKKLFTTTISALRSYRDIKTIEKQKLGYRKVIDASSDLYQYDSLKTLLQGMLIQLSALVCHASDAVMMIESQCVTDGVLLTENDMEYDILAATGRFQGLENNDVQNLPSNMVSCMQNEELDREKEIFSFGKNYIFTKHTSKIGNKNYFYMELDEELKNKELLKVFITNASLIVDNYLVHEVASEQQKKLILKLGQIMQQKDLSTYFHMNRVSQIASFLADATGIDKKTTKHIEIATSLHDVGKVIIPNKILNKPGKLTHDEFEVMKRHCEAGFELFSVANTDLLKLTSEITLCHHERYDGRGYPRALKGDEIPIGARIATLADVFDTLNNDRVYRKAWSFDETIQYVKEQSARIFDPNLVDILLDNQNHLKDLIDKYKP